MSYAIWLNTVKAEAGADFEAGCPATRLSDISVLAEFEALQKCTAYDELIQEQMLLRG